MNNHISNITLGLEDKVWSHHVFNCGKSHGKLINEELPRPYFKINIFLRFRETDSQKLLFYEKDLFRKGHATLHKVSDLPPDKRKKSKTIKKSKNIQKVKNKSKVKKKYAKK